MELKASYYFKCNLCVLIFTIFFNISPLEAGFFNKIKEKVQNNLNRGEQEEKETTKSKKETNTLDQLNKKTKAFKTIYFEDTPEEVALKVKVLNGDDSLYKAEIGTSWSLMLEKVMKPHLAKSIDREGPIKRGPLDQSYVKQFKNGVLVDKWITCYEYSIYPEGYTAYVKVVGGAGADEASGVHYIKSYWDVYDYDKLYQVVTEGVSVNAITEFHEQPYCYPGAILSWSSITTTWEKFGISYKLYHEKNHKLSFDEKNADLVINSAPKSTISRQRLMTKLLRATRYTQGVSEAEWTSGLIKIKEMPFDYSKYIKEYIRAFNKAGNENRGKALEFALNPNEFNFMYKNKEELKKLSVSPKDWKNFEYSMFSQDRIKKLAEKEKGLIKMIEGINMSDKNIRQSNRIDDL